MGASSLQSSFTTIRARPHATLQTWKVALYECTCTKCMTHRQTTHTIDVGRFSHHPVSYIRVCITTQHQNAAQERCICIKIGGRIVGTASPFQYHWRQRLSVCLSVCLAILLLSQGAPCLQHSTRSTSGSCTASRPVELRKHVVPGGMRIPRKCTADIPNLHAFCLLRAAEDPKSSQNPGPKPRVCRRLCKAAAPPASADQRHHASARAASAPPRGCSGRAACPAGLRPTVCAQDTVTGPNMRFTGSHSSQQLTAPQQHTT